MTLSKQFEIPSRCRKILDSRGIRDPTVKRKKDVPAKFKLIKN
jgi:hypothetical protein